MTVETIRARNIQTGLTIYDWPLADWNLHDDLYHADWVVEAQEPTPVSEPVEPAVDPVAEPEQPAQ